MATTKKAAVKKVTKPKGPAKDTFVIIRDVYDVVGVAATEELALIDLRTMIADDANDRYYDGNEYCIYKLVKRVRVNIEQPLPVVKLTTIKD